MKRLKFKRMNRKKFIISALILLTVVVLTIIYRSNVKTSDVVVENQNNEHQHNHANDMVEPPKDKLSDIEEPKTYETASEKSDLKVMLKSFNKSLPKISEIKSKKIDKHRPGLILYEMVDQLGELEDELRESLKNNDRSQIVKIVAAYASCAKDKEIYLPARALCLERIHAHSKEFKLDYNAKDYPVDVRVLLETPDNL